MNEDGTFKGGFDGCVLHMMEIEGHDKESATKICGYIAERVKAVAARLGEAMPGLLIPSGAGVPSEIQWMPPGWHTIEGLKAGTDEPITVTVEANEAAARRLNDLLQYYRSKAAAGSEDLPFFDFNHEDSEASGHPLEFFWAGDGQAGGIRVKVEWTGAGKRAIEDKSFRRFSPEFGVSEANQITALGLNMGGLVNRAAFKTIQPIWSRDGGAPKNKQSTKEDEMIDEKKFEELLNSVATLGKTVTAIQARLGEAEKASADERIKALETQVNGLKEANTVAAKAAASAIVRKAVEGGKIPPGDAQAIETWTNLVLLDAKNAELLDKMATNPALKRVIGPASMGGAGMGDEPEFMVKAKEFAKTRGITSLVEAQQQFAMTVEGSALYNAYREGLNPTGGK